MTRPCLFVTGTDTGVGKTTVSCALLAAWRRQGRAVTPLKPIETGCGPELRAQDAERLASAAGTDPRRACLSRWSSPVAPEAAAMEAGQIIDVQALVAACHQVKGERVLVEGAGGLLVPIAPGYTQADLAASLGAAVLIVARCRLGTINHTLLTLAECRRRGLPVIGVVLNRCEDVSAPDDSANAELIERHGGATLLGTLPYTVNQDELVELGRKHLALDQIWACMHRHGG